LAVFFYFHASDYFFDLPTIVQSFVLLSKYYKIQNVSSSQVVSLPEPLIFISEMFVLIYEKY